jgi:hypothetical protein
MSGIASKFTQQNSENELIAIYSEYINNRIKFLQSALQ